MREKVIRLYFIKTLIQFYARLLNIIYSRVSDPSNYTKKILAQFGQKCILHYKKKL